VHLAIVSSKTLKDNRRGTNDNKTDRIEMRASPIDVRPTTQGHLYLINPTFA
jgi:hypothetical protein